MWGTPAAGELGRHPGLIVIGGPTATGKTQLAIALAQRLQTLILNADSRQVYRGLDIGTAKPTPFEQQQAPHFLIDICDPTETLTVAEYQAQAQALIAQVHAGSGCQVPILVGGTGLYIRAVVRGLKIPQVSAQPELRHQLQTLGQSHCYTLLRQVDEAAAHRIHSHDHVRTLRALEVFYATGKPISEQQGEVLPDYPILQIGLDCDRPALIDRIVQRTTQMVNHGLVEEVQTLMAQYGTDLPLLKTLGYQEFKDFLSGFSTLQEAQDLTILHTRQFAKRQQTWFRAVPEIKWFNADHFDVLEQVWATVQVFLRDISYQSEGL